ncbi:MAG: D-amino acid aminotransferase [Planctomycetota bacterium]|nr:MAG: D-amino acid aminotransferase [Planctomycetota bacterium]
MLVAINGERRDPERATVSVFDRGFLFGDAVYEVVRTHGRRPFHLEAHLERLRRSGDAIGLDVAALLEPVQRTVAELVAAAPAGEDLMIRLMITRGNSPRLDLLEAEGPPCWVVMVKELEPFPERYYREGLRLLTVRPEEIVSRVAPWVKSNNRQANVMAHRLARERGHDDALFVDPDGHVSEGPTWNLFAVLDGGVVTPPLAGGVLPGVTRGLVLGLCASLGLPHEERPISLEEARRADELFVTSTTRGVMPVGRLDGEPVGDGTVPGPVTARLADGLRRLEAESAAG